MSNAFRSDSSNSSITKKPCAYAFVTLVAGMVFLSAGYRHTLLSKLWKVMRVSYEILSAELLRLVSAVFS